MEITDWLLKQIPVIVVMGVVIYYMYKYIKAKDVIIAAKDEATMKMAEKVLTVASLWDVKSDLNTKEHEKILLGLSDLIDFAKSCKYDK